MMGLLSYIKCIMVRHLVVSKVTPWMNEEKSWHSYKREWKVIKKAIILDELSFLVLFDSPLTAMSSKAIMGENTLFSLFILEWERKSLKWNQYPLQVHQLRHYSAFLLQSHTKCISEDQGQYTFHHCGSQTCLCINILGLLDLTQKTLI